jgi:hypothetical protein
MRSVPYFLSLIVSSTQVVGVLSAQAQERGLPTDPQTIDRNLPEGPDVGSLGGSQEGAETTAGHREPMDDKRASKSTAQNQSTRPESLQITRQIRKQIMEQRELSTAARNVKVITDENGAVTLRGPVKSSAERQQLEQIARNNAPGGQVDNQLVVKNEETTRGAAHG